MECPRYGRRSAWRAAQPSRARTSWAAAKLHLPKKTAKTFGWRCCVATPAFSLRAQAKQSSVSHQPNLACFVALAPLRKRFAFVAGNDSTKRAASFDHLVGAGEQRL